MRNSLLITIILVLFLVIVSGCTSNTSSGPQINSVWGNFTVTYNVVNDSGNNVNFIYHPVYSISGHFTSSNFKIAELGGGSGTTYDNGTTYSLETMWPVNPGDYIVFGASNNWSWLNEDMANIQFNPGKAGYWTVLTYDDITNYTKYDRSATINVTVVVSAETGKMKKET